MTLRLYSYPDNYRVQKSLIAAQYNGVAVETPAFTFGVDNKKPEFLAKFPNGKVPALETPAGPLYESGAILKYIARLRSDTGLYGDNFYEAALVEQWIDWAAFEFEPAAGAWTLTVAGYIEFNPLVIAEAKADITKFLALLDAHFVANTYLVGKQITLADIVVYTALNTLLKSVLTVSATSKYVNLGRWINTLANQPQFIAVLGELKQCTTEKQAEKKQGGAGGEQKKADKPKGEEKKKDAKKEDKPKAKKEDKPKAEKKEDKPKEEEKKDLAQLLEDEEKAAAPKPKSALDLLPKSPMVLDAVKKMMFTEKPYNPKFFQNFFEGSDEVTRFDPVGYSVFTCEYKYNDEHTKFFLSCNLMGGFLQRSERVRKYAFGVLNMLGQTEDSPPWNFCGVWIFRGQEVPLEMREVDDSEHFNWTKIDATTAAGRKIVEEAFVADKVNGLEALERRYFK